FAWPTVPHGPSTAICCHPSCPVASFTSGAAHAGLSPRWNCQAPSSGTDPLPNPSIFSTAEVLGDPPDAATAAKAGPVISAQRPQKTKSANTLRRNAWPYTPDRVYGRID